MRYNYLLLNASGTFKVDSFVPIAVRAFRLKLDGHGAVVPSIKHRHDAPEEDYENHGPRE